MITYKKVKVELPRDLECVVSMEPCFPFSVLKIVRKNFEGSVYVSKSS